MNFVNHISLANDNSSEETESSNFTKTTRFSDIDGLTYATVVIRFVIFAVGTIGNLIVVVVLLWRRSRLQVGTQLFVGSLAASDIGLMMSTVWVRAYDALQKSWLSGVIPCKLHFMTQFLWINCSLWILAVLSIDRYLCSLKYPYNVFV